MPVDLDRLQAQLLQSGIQTKNNPLYQVINQLIKSEKDLQNQIANSFNTITNIINNLTLEGTPPVVLIGLDDSTPFDPIPIPGKDGKDGKNGLTIPGLDGLDGQDAIPIPGTPGPKGDIGLLGPPGLDGYDSEYFLIPGPIGPTGRDGLTIPGLDGQDNSEGCLFPPGTPSTGGGGGTPGGSDTQVQFNDSGAFGGDAGLIYNKTTDTLSVPKVSTTSGAFTLQPAAGSGITFTLSTTGDFIINTTLVVVDVSALTVGIGTAPETTCKFHIVTDADASGIWQALYAGGNRSAGALGFTLSNTDTSGSSFIGLGHGVASAGTADFYIEHLNSTNVTSPGQTNIVQGGTALLHFQTNGNSAIFINSTQKIRMPSYGAGAATFDASGNITSVSDLRLKEKIAPYLSGLAELRQLNPIRYHWKSEAGLDTLQSYVGFGAQDVLPWLPDAINEHRRTGELSFNPFVVVAALVNAIKELALRVDILDNKKEADAVPILDHAKAIELDKVAVDAQVASEIEAQKKDNENRTRDPNNTIKIETASSEKDK